MKTLALPEAERRVKRKLAAQDDSLSVYKSRLRPNLKDIIADQPNLQSGD